MKNKTPNYKELQTPYTEESRINQNIGFALRWVYKNQGWKGNSICKRIHGYKEKTWDSYAQAGYTKKRAVHAVAAFCWLSQVSMSKLYHGPRLWQGFDQELIKVKTYSSALTTDQFDSLIRLFRDRIKFVTEDNEKKVEDLIKELQKYSDSDFLIPRPLDLELFKQDYYNSISYKLKELRIEKELSIEFMAYTLGVSVSKYISFESPDKLTYIPLNLAIRLKLGLHYNDTYELLGRMDKFKGFYQSRHVQKLRSSLLSLLLQNLPLSEKLVFCELAKNIMDFHFN
ncbi:helix-turn-helix transcriptional regulator [Agarilytica rhodophyticola]|uniref:helix-turn-helix transcriptional regulator n=1 Tax=Agarilytica rhodophyticola TaxID=1737490 RepID=UPI000B3417FE|nr:helix-turn-helix transcriptional regulator [Agarilytica rhodophyticola]